MSKAGYHHGTLRQALVDVALDILARDGAARFTLARAAKAAGVTPAAVYRHFKGRADLIAEMARQGHERLALLTDTAIKDKDTGSAVLSYGTAFLAFAEEFPGHFAAMYTAGIDRDNNPELAAAEAQGTAIRRRLAEGLLNGSPTPRASTIAAHLHALCLGSVWESRGDTNQLTEALKIYLAGLGASPLRNQDNSS